MNDGLLELLLISHDICLKPHLKHYGGHGYDHIMRRVVPLMKTLGITPEEINTLIVDNPAKFVVF